LCFLLFISLHFILQPSPCMSSHLSYVPNPRIAERIFMKFDMVVDLSKHSGFR
jgi:hypothetical protein